MFLLTLIYFPPFFYLHKSLCQGVLTVSIWQDLVYGWHSAFVTLNCLPFWSLKMPCFLWKKHVLFFEIASSYLIVVITASLFICYLQLTSIYIKHDLSESWCPGHAASGEGVIHSVRKAFQRRWPWAELERGVPSWQVRCRQIRCRAHSGRRPAVRDGLAWPLGRGASRCAFCAAALLLDAVTGAGRDFGLCVEYVQGSFR